MDDNTNNQRIPVNGWIYPDQVTDSFLDWWKSIPKGEKSGVVLKALQLYANLTEDDPMKQVNADVAWIKNALNDLPGYLANLLSEITVTVAPSTETKSLPDSEPVLSESELSLRRENRKKQAEKWG